MQLSTSRDNAAMKTPIRIGVDLGGTKIEIVALDSRGTELLRRRIPTPQGNYEATVNAIVALVEDVERSLNTHASVGIGIPGAVSVGTGLVKNANSTCLIGKPLQAELAARLGRAIRLENDANCFGLSEAIDGAGAGASVVFAVILGTGVGGAIVVKNNVLQGRNAIAGEWGHNPMPGPEPFLPACYCGRHGCIETFLSGPGLAADHARATGNILNAEEISLSAAQGDASCEETLVRYEQRLARALATVINVLDPDVIVLGGGVSNLDRLYTNVPRLWGEHVFSDTVATRLVKHKHGDASGVRGAAWLWPGA